MTWRSTLAGLVLCIGCTWPSVAPAQALPPSATWLSRDVLASSGALTHSPTYTLSFSFQMPASSADRWWARDKAQHVAFSFLWTLSTQYVLVDKAGWSNHAALPVAAGSGAAVGLSKEWIDWRYGPAHRFSTRDLVADAAGILLAVGVILL